MPETTGTPRQTALITGASAGIGRELATVFAAHGFDLVVVARRSAELEKVADALRSAHGVEVRVIALDLATPAAPQALFDSVRRLGIDVDVLVNNAGTTAYGDFLDIPLEAHSTLIQLNIAALMSLTHLFARPMVERGRGRVLNVASISAFQPFPTLALYAASKAFVLSLGESLAVELRGTGVTVTTCCPGFTETTMVHTPSATTGRATSLPGLLVGDPAQVARDAFEACARGDAVQVSGVVNQVATFWMQYQPRWLGRAISSWIRHLGR